MLCGGIKRCLHGDTSRCRRTAAAASVRAASGRSSALRVFLCESVLCGAFVRARRALTHHKTAVSGPGSDAAAVLRELGVLGDVPRRPRGLRGLARHLQHRRRRLPHARELRGRGRGLRADGVLRAGHHDAVALRGRRRQLRPGRPRRARPLRGEQRRRRGRGRTAAARWTSSCRTSTRWSARPPPASATPSSSSGSPCDPLACPARSGVVCV